MERTEHGATRSGWLFLGSALGLSISSFGARICIIFAPVKHVILLLKDSGL